MKANLDGQDAPNTIRKGQRHLAVAGVAAAFALLLSACWSANQDKDLNYINNARGQNGKPALQGDPELMAKAQAWAEELSRSGNLRHSGPNGSVNTNGIINWCGVAENVGVGGSTYIVHQAFMNSPGHRGNVLGNFDRVGTGVVGNGDNAWVVEIYVRSC